MNKEATKKATRQDFIEAFIVLYKQSSIEGITVKKVVLKAGYNRATFYRHFKNIEDLATYAGEVVSMRIKETYEDMSRHLENPHIDNVKKIAGSMFAENYEKIAFLSNSEFSFLVKDAFIEKMSHMFYELYPHAAANRRIYMDFIIAYHYHGTTEMMRLYDRMRDKIEIPELVALISALGNKGPFTCMKELEEQCSTTQK